MCGSISVVRLNPPFHLAFLVIFITLGFSGCVVGDFLGTYFNTYYNASTLFGEAEEEIWNQTDTKLTGHNLLALTTTIPATSRTKLASVVEKCSKLLQEHPNSAYVDDALLMIGKAFYYQGDYTRADRKFKELLTTYPESNLVLEARLWMAYAEYKENNLDQAETSAKRLLDDAQKDDDSKTAAVAALLLGKIRGDRQDYAGACNYYAITGANAENADLRASAYLTAGDMYLAASDSVDAYSMYQKAAKESRNYQITYHADFGQATALSRMGRGSQALDQLRDMRNNTNYKEFWGEVDVETGNAYRREEKYPEAIAQYQYVDTAYAKSEWAANADYQLGLLWEQVYGEFDSARVAYARGRAASSTAKIAPLVTARSDMMNRYALYRRSIQINDSLLAIDTAAIKPPDTAAIRPPDTAAVKPADTVAQVSKEADSLSQHAEAIDKKVQDSAVVAPKKVEPAIPPDTLRARLALAINELATLFYTELSLPDSAVALFDTLLTRFPDDPNKPRAWYVLAHVAAARDSVAGTPVADSLYRLIIRDYPKTGFAAEARRILGLPPIVIALDSAEASYHESEQLLLKGDYQTAIDTLRAIVRSYPRSPFASRAQYAAGWLYEEKLSQTDSAIIMYRRLLKNYPASTYAALVRPKVDAVDVEIRKAQEEAKIKAQEEAKKMAAEQAKLKASDSTNVKPAPAPADSTAPRHIVPGKLGPVPVEKDTTKSQLPRPPGADSLNVRQDPR